MKPMLQIGRRLSLCASLAGTIALLSGCQTPSHPDSPRPQSPLPSGFQGSLPALKGNAARAVDARWWQAFDDPLLDGLVARAVSANHDLKLADARMREARALWIENGAARWPSVGATVEYRREHQPPIEKDKEPLLDQYFVSGFDATWEADLFGRVRSLTTAARADFEAQNAACDDMAITIAAEVARNYFELRGQQQSLEANRRSVKWRAIELDLIRRRAALGVANPMDIDNARRSLDRQRADGNDLEAAIVRTVQALGVLTAQPAGALKPLLAVPATPDHEPATPALGTPAELLRSRPDIRDAEQELVASSAVKDAAKADLLPRLTFSGQLSFFAFGWGLGPDLTWDVFNRRRIRAREVRASARADASFARYQLAVLTAVADVENALANLKAARGRRDALMSVSEDSTRLAEAVKRRAALGVANKLDEAAAEQTAGDAAGALAAQEAAVDEAWVAVFKALGGGWKAPAGDIEPEQSGAHRPSSQDGSLPPTKS